MNGKVYREEEWPYLVNATSCTSGTEIALHTCTSASCTLPFFAISLVDSW